MSECQVCKRRKAYNSCLSKEWFEPADMRYCSAQIIWVIRNISTLRDGFWPVDHRETGYAGSTNKPNGHRAPFEKAAIVAATAERRLTECGVDGLILEYIISLDYGDRVELENRLAHYLKTTIEDIDTRFNYAMGYCCGYRERPYPYTRFISFTKHRRNNRRRN